MRRMVTAAVVLSLALAACASGQNRTFQRYYDPEGLFSTYLPAGNNLTVDPPQPSSSGPALLSGVVSAPPQPSPSPAGGTGLFGAGLTQVQPTDQTIYQVFAVTTDRFPTLDDMVLYFLTGDPQVDTKIEQPLRLGGIEGRLIEADVSGTNGAASLAATFTLGDGGKGYIVAAVFPQGDWQRERSDFMRVVASFETHVPPGVQTFQLSSTSA